MSYSTKQMKREIESAFKKLSDSFAIMLALEKQITDQIKRKIESAEK